METITRAKKPNKCTEDIGLYMAAYRMSRPEYFKNYEKIKYYKKRHGMPQSFITDYGEHAADVFKLVMLFQKVITQKPDLIDVIFKELNVD